MRKSAKEKYEKCIIITGCTSNILLLGSRQSLGMHIILYNEPKSHVSRVEIIHPFIVLAGYLNTEYKKKIEVKYRSEIVMQYIRRIKNSHLRIVRGDKCC